MYCSVETMVLGYYSLLVWLSKAGKTILFLVYVTKHCVLTILV